MRLQKKLATHSLTLTLLLTPLLSFAQSLELGKSLEVQLNILKEVSTLYVDSVSLESLLWDASNYMLNRLDPYTVLIRENDSESLEMMTRGSYGGIGAIIRKKGENILIAEVYEGSAAAKVGIIDGDQIIALDGEPVAPLSVEECSAKMRGGPGTNLRVTLKRLRGGDTLSLNIVREKIHIPDLLYWGMVADSVGYIKSRSFTSGGVKEIREALQKLVEEESCKRVVLDLRDNGGGLLSEAVEMLSLFLPQRSLVVSSKGRAKEDNMNFYTTTPPVDTLIPLVVLVNSASASSSEIVAGALQDLDRATIIGSRTFGKGLVQSIRDVGYGNNIKITTARYYTPAGRSLQAIDYSHREEDGSVGSIPDSLKSAFKTLRRGRVVYDGGGIEPDSTVLAKEYSRPVIGLAYSNLLHQYSIEYSSKVDTIAPVAQFELSNANYLEFVEWASKQQFDHRSRVLVEYDKLIELASMEGGSSQLLSQLKSLRSTITLSKKETLIKLKDEIKPLLEMEIINRYYFQRGAVQYSLKEDRELKVAMEINLLD
ncbi:MAG: S41 family peptidase [Bacteroidales bacterium]